MNFNTDLLFIYGSLLDINNEFGAYLQQNSTFVGLGKLSGKLYNLGDYPGAIAGDYSDDFVHGSVVRLKNPRQDLEIIDKYEGFGEDEEEPNLFVRSIKTIITDSESVKCWVYLYNLPVDQAERIYSGVYIREPRDKSQESGAGFETRSMSQKARD